MRVLVVGSGGREHALVARVCQDVGREQVLAAPGNPGIAELVRTAPLDITSPEAIADLAASEAIDLTIVGPELPLSLGVVDAFQRRGLAIFGPTAAAAQLESSKAFAKAFMARHGVPTARFVTCESHDEAMRVVRAGQFGLPVVLKADGLAAGKGVVIAQTTAEAEDAVTAAMADDRFGAAGHRLVVEECLIGPEVSFFVVSDGVHALPIGTAQDHKRIFDNDEGPNTGGMGAFAPSPLVDQALSDRVMREIVRPVIDGMAREGTPFSGFLYVGLMLTAAGPKVIEFNARLGDPEAQVILPLIDEPLVPILAAAAAMRLRQDAVGLSSDRLVGVVLASRGYPEASDTGQTIRGLDEAAQTGASVIHAGTRRKNGDLVTAGGRVLTVVARGDSFPMAIARAYDAVSRISFDGMQFRRDIGKKAFRI